MQECLYKYHRFLVVVKKVRRVIIYIMFFFILLSAFSGIVFSTRSFAVEKDSKNIFSFFKEEIEANNSSLKFEILDSSYAKFNFIGGFADGTYKLASYKTKYLGRGVFKLYLLFKKRKGIFRYEENLILYFWQGDKEVVFLTRSGKIKFKLPEEVVKIIRTKKGYEFIRSFPIKIYTIPLEHSKVVLKVRKR